MFKAGLGFDGLKGDGTGKSAASPEIDANPVAFFVRLGRWVGIGCLDDGGEGRRKPYLRGGDQPLSGGRSLARVTGVARVAETRW